jgi:hypothetical protein
MIGGQRRLSLEDEPEQQRDRPRRRAPDPGAGDADKSDGERDPVPLALVETELAGRQVAKGLEPVGDGRRTADATAAKISQIGGGALRRPRRAAPLPREDCPSLDGGDLDDLDRVVDEGLAMMLM